MKDKRILIASIGTALVGGGIFFLVRKLSKDNQFAELMLAIRTDQAEQTGELSYLKAFDPTFYNQKDSLGRSRILYTTANADKLVDKIHAAVKGIGTDEAAINSSYSSIENQQKMSQVAARYLSRHGKNLLDVLTSELNTKERSTLFSIIKSKPEMQFTN